MKLINFSTETRVFDPVELKNGWLTLAYRIAEQIQATGGQRKLRDMTINKPVDHAAIAVIDMACQALIKGDFSRESADLDRELTRMSAETPLALKLGPAMLNMADKLLPDGFSQD